MDIRKKLLKKRIKIIETERRDSHIKNNLAMLSEENKRFIELKYGDKRSLDEIGQILNMAKTTAHRKREELVENIYIIMDWDYKIMERIWNKTMKNL